MCGPCHLAVRQQPGVAGPSADQTLGQDVQELHRAPGRILALLHQDRGRAVRQHCFRLENRRWTALLQKNNLQQIPADFQRDLHELAEEFSG